jgi:glycosyltransferase involved in cell wall biosynthesis
LNLTLGDRVNAAQQSNPERKRCAVVESHSRHDEVYLTTVHLLQQLGYEVEVFNTLRNRVKNSFVHAPGLQPQVHSFLRPAQVLEAVLRRRFDFVVLNTFEGHDVLDCAGRLLLDTPVLGFVHNGSFVANLPEYLPYLAHPQCRLMVLAPHVAAHFSHLAAAGCVYPIFFFDREVPTLPRNAGRRRFCVQGRFDTTRRDYDGLLEALRQLRRESRSDFEVYVTGRNFSKSFRDFAQVVREAGLADHVRYTWEGIGYRNYYRLLNSVDFILPLITPDSHPGYFKSKSDSSMAAAVGFNALPVAHEALARNYGLADIAFTYSDSVLPAMRRALDISDQDLAVRRERLANARQRYLTASMHDLEKAIASLRVDRGVQPSPPDLRPVEALAG